jgi:hypothetical protein
VASTHRWSTRFVLVCVCACALAGCGGKAETEFVLQYTDLYCDAYLKCVDPVLQVFDGMPTQEECEGTYGPPMSAQSDVCKLEKKAARACLDGMATMKCPSDGEEIEDVLPAACASVWKKCEGPVPQAGDDEAPDAG